MANLCGRRPSVCHRCRCRPVRSKRRCGRVLVVGGNSAPVAPELGGDPLFLAGYNRVIGSVRLRQVRVMRDSCTVPEMFEKLITA